MKDFYKCREMKKNETDLDLNRNHLKNKWGLIEFSHYTATNTENFFHDPSMLFDQLFSQVYC